MNSGQKLSLVVNSSNNTISNNNISDNTYSLVEKQTDHNRLIENYILSRKLRNHSKGTIKGVMLILNRLFNIMGMFCWELNTNDINEYHENLFDSGLTLSTRRGYINTISNFYDFLLSHPEIPLSPIERKEGKISERVDWKYKVKLEQPVDKWFSPVHISEDSTVKSALPSKNSLREFFRYIRTQANTSRKPFVTNRDYALFSLMYHSGIRQDECRMIDVSDVNFEHRTIHIRFGKGTKGSGKRERWVPIVLHGIEKILKDYIDKVRPKFIKDAKCNALFLSEFGNRISLTTIKDRLQRSIINAQEHNIEVPYFTCHDFRRSFATHMYESDPIMLSVIKEMLGHENLSTTQRYIRPSAKFLEQSLNKFSQNRLSSLMGEKIDD
jgi:parallel beta-helix repeat protein